LIGIEAAGTGQEIAANLLTRGKVLTSHLTTMPQVISGIISTEVGGTRQITGSPGLFARLAQNLGVQDTIH
jgi:hypothetical protein